MTKKQSARLCAAGVKLRSQINKKYPNRDKASDGWIGDAKHQKTKSDHNPDKNGIVRALDIDADLGKGISSFDLADQLRLLAKNGEKRISYIIHNKKIASSILNWRWRNYTGSNPHLSHIHISFTSKGDIDGSAFDINIQKTDTLDNVLNTINAKKELEKLLAEKKTLDTKIANLKKKYKLK